MLYRVISIYYSLLKLKVGRDCQTFNCKVTSVYRNAQGRLSLFSHMQIPGQKEVIEMDVGRPPPPPRPLVAET